VFASTVDFGRWRLVGVGVGSDCGCAERRRLKTTTRFVRVDTSRSLLLLSSSCANHFYSSLAEWMSVFARHALEE
jgi:hypothetical protein